MHHNQSGCFYSIAVALLEGHARVKNQASTGIGPWCNGDNQPDIVIARADEPIRKEQLNSASLRRSSRSSYSAQTAKSIYDVPVS